MATALQPIYQPNPGTWSESPRQVGRPQSQVSSELRKHLVKIIVPAFLCVLCASVVVTGRVRLVEANNQKASLQSQLKKLEIMKEMMTAKLSTKVSQLQVDQWVAENGFVKAGNDAMAIGNKTSN